MLWALGKDKSAGIGSGGTNDMAYKSGRGRATQSLARCARAVAPSNASSRNPLSIRCLRNQSRTAAAPANGSNSQIEPKWVTMVIRPSSVVLRS